MARERVALGLRSHSGWAVLIALQGPVSTPVVVDRRRLELCDKSFPRQPYHAAENLPAARAEALVSRSLETAAKLARAAVAAAIEKRRAEGQEVAGAGLLCRRPLPRARSGLASRSSTAEGEMSATCSGGCESGRRVRHASATSLAPARA
jgi:hypothetical protein